MNKNKGFSAAELLVVLAIIGILVSGGVLIIPRGDIELEQAARGFSLSVQKARSEAIRNNKFAGIVVPTNSVFSVFVDEDQSRTYTDGDTIISKINLATEYPSVSITKNSGNQIVFEPRGFVWGAINQTIVFSSSKSSTTIDAIIGLQGQVKLN